jgi:nicotinate-nucleotide pyrophosphorylase (carboxylating)
MKRPTELTREIREVVAAALEEDVGAGDITSEALVPADVRGRASIVQKQPGVLFGLELTREALLECGAETFDSLVVEGRWREEVPAVVARASGPGRALLAGERVALNLLGRLSGVATLTSRYVRAVEGTGARILDTRKTTPGLRGLEKAAVVAGGGHNHRFGLHDAILVKENHIALAGGVADAVARARGEQPGMEIEIECGTLDEVREAVGAEAETLLLDNMSPAELAEAVTTARELAGPLRRVRLEASGGISLENVAKVAVTGVDEISVGALTHSAPALDVSMDIELA